MPHILFLHAATRDRHDLDGFAARVEGATVQTVDLLGHGDAPRTPRYQVDDYARAIPLEDDTVLYGHSLGGVVALALAVRHPARVRALVLEDPPLFAITPERMRGGRFERGFALLAQQKRDPAGPKTAADWAALIRDWPAARPGETLADQGEDAVGRRARQLAAFDTAVIDALLAGLATHFSVPAALTALACPATCLAGNPALGAAICDDDARRLAEHPRIAVRRADTTGHYLHEAEPELCLTALAEHL